MDRLENWMVAAAVFLAPWASVDLLRAAGLPGLAVGVQPAVLPLLLLVLLVGLRWRGRIAPTETAVVVALIWMVAAAALSWSLVDMGLAGQRPWSKALKQLAQWMFFAGAALAVARVVARDRCGTVERALCAGVVVACLVALLRAVAGPGLDGGILDTNPSIASGSDELYLGHSFTGIARLRGAMPEPLLLGSYLLATVPLVAASAARRRGRARAWRAIAAGLGLACLVATWSRGAWLGAVATAVALAVVANRGRLGSTVRGRTLVAVAASVTALLLAGASLVLQASPWEVCDLLVRRIGQSLATHDMSNMTRVWAWKVGWDLFLESPLPGQGLGSYGFLFFRHASEAASAAHFGWPVPNNLALLLLAETGLVGLALWCVAVAPVLAPLVRPGRPVLATLLACTALGVLVHLATFSQWNLPHLWLLLGAGWGVARLPGSSSLEDH